MTAQVWDGTTWQVDAQIWNGTEFRSDGKVWDGTTWVPFTPGGYDPLSIDWASVFWADRLSGATRPAEGASAPGPLSNLGSDSGSWTKNNNVLWTRNFAGKGKDAGVFGSGASYSYTRSAASPTRTWVLIGRARGADSDWVDTSGTRTLFDASGGNFRAYCGSVTSAGAYDTNMHLVFVEAVGGGGATTVTIDGIVKGTGTASENGGSGLWLGDSGLGSGNVNGTELAFAGYLTRLLTTQEKTDLINWYQESYVDVFPPPTNLSTSPELTQITVSWSPVLAAVGYRLFVDGVEQTSLGLITGTSATVTGLTQGELYSFKVLAEKADTTQSLLSQPIVERACLLASATQSSTSGTNGGALNNTGLGVSVPAYLAYNWNMRKTGSQFWWYLRNTSTPLYGYLGRWANGITIEKVSGDLIRVIEWQRGAESWRQTDLVNPGDTMTVDFDNTTMNAGTSVLEGPLDNVLIEHGAGTTSFVCKIWNWNPTPIPPDLLTLESGDQTLTANWVGQWPDYEVRIDGGSWISKGSTLTHTFTGLTNGETHVVDVRYVTPIGSGEHITAIGSSSASFTPRDISWTSLLWASEASMVPETNGAIISSRPKDSQELTTGDPGGSWAISGNPSFVSNVAGSGLPAFGLNGVSDRLLRTPTNGIGGEVTIVTVGRITSVPVDIHDSRTSGQAINRVLLDVNGTKWRVFGGATSQESAGDYDTNLHLFVAYFNPSGNEVLEIDGVEIINASGGNSLFGGGLAYGATAGTIAPYGGSEIAFGATINRALTIQEKSDLLAWFQNTY